MKIGFDAKRAFSNRAGLGNYSRNILNALLSYYPDNEYILYTPENSLQLYEPKPNQKVIMPSGSWKKTPSLWRALHLSAEIKKEKPDIYHGLSHELPRGIQRTGTRPVVTIHDLIFLRYPEFYKPLDRYIYKKKFRYACKTADQIIAISQQTKADIIQFFGIAEQKINVVYQPVHQRFFNALNKEDLNEVKRKYQLPHEFILNVGTIEPRKNLLTVLETMVAENLDYPLLVIGQPTSYLKTINAYIAKHPRLKVIFLRNVTNEELNAIYRMAKMVIYPSVFEGFGLPVVEALACGTPVVTSNISSLPEAGGNAAIQVNPTSLDEMGTAMRHLLTNDEFYQQHARKAIKHAQHFTPEKAARNLWDVYQKWG